jgi:hypothetical protein
MASAAVFRSFARMSFAWLMVTVALPAASALATPPTPRPAAAPVWSNHGPYGGLVADLAADPSAPGTFFAGAYRRLT